MSLVASSEVKAKKQVKQADKIPTPTGMQRAVFSKVLDLGWHLNKKYNKKQHKILILWELEKRIEDEKYKDKRYIISRAYNFKTTEGSHLARHIESFTSKKLPNDPSKRDFDVSTFEGKTCMLNIVQNEEWFNVENVLPDIGGEALTPELEDYPEWIKKQQKLGGVTPTEAAATDIPDTTEDDL